LFRGKENARKCQDKIRGLRKKNEKTIPWKRGKTKKIWKATSNPGRIAGNGRHAEKW